MSFKSRVSFYYEMIFRRLVKESYKFIYFLLSWPVYGRISATSFVSPMAGIKDHRNVFLGNRTNIHRNAVVWGELTTGVDVTIGPGTCIYGKVSLGDHVMIAPNVMIAGGNHGVEKNGTPMLYQVCSVVGVHVHDDVWVGANAVILDGVTIGKGAVLGAASVVTKDVPEYAVVVGNPAKIVKYRKLKGR